MIRFQQDSVALRDGACLYRRRYVRPDRKSPILTGLLGLLVSRLLVQHLTRPRFCRVLGLLMGLSWYYVSVRLLWPDLNLDVIRYQPASGALLDYVVLGLVLGLYPSFWLFWDFSGWRR